MGNLSNNLSYANKYRPQVFEDVLGQQATVAAIKGKLLEGKLPRTSLYCGAHGSGKTTLARIVAKAVNCSNLSAEGNPCCECESCKAIDAGVSPDVIELDAASHNKVDDAEAIVKQASFLPLGKKKVIILDEFHMMTKEAQNKLLKMVEEPPEHVHFIFATTEENRILPTILSRCNKFTFKAISDDDVYSNLLHVCEKEDIGYEDDALKLITKSANGHVRDSLSLLEQLSYEKLTAKRVSNVLGLATDEQIFDILQCVLLKDMKALVPSVDNILRQGNIQGFLKDVVRILCYMITFDENVVDNETKEFRDKCAMFADALTPAVATEFVKIITCTLRDNKALGLDLAARLCFLTMIVEQEKEDKIKSLEEEVNNLKAVISNGAIISQTVVCDNKEDAFISSENMDTSEEIPEFTEDIGGFDASDEVWNSPASDDFFAPAIAPDDLDFSEESTWTEVSASTTPVANKNTVNAEDTLTPFDDAVVVKPRTVMQIPGGTIVSKKEKKEGIPVAETDSKNVDKEAPVLGGSFDDNAGFEDIGSFGGGFFGSNNVSFF